jgi:hypothetical protein
VLPLELDPPSPPPRGTALPPVRSADEPGSRVADPAPVLPWAAADVTPAASTATNVPTSNLPRFMATLLEFLQQPVCQGRFWSCRDVLHFTAIYHRGPVRSWQHLLSSKAVAGRTVRAGRRLIRSVF